MALEKSRVVQRAILCAMPDRSRRPRDPNQLAKLVVDIATGEVNDAPEDTGKLRGVLEDAERKQILAALRQTNWIVAGPKGAAALLGMKRSTLQAHMQRLGIRVSRAAG